MSVDIIDGSFRERIAQLLNTRKKRVWLASPFVSYPIARWLATLPPSAHGDRRLVISWAAESLDAGYLSARGVDVLRASGFYVRDLRRLHAKMIVVGASAYFGSGNLTRFGIEAGNTEIGVFADGSHAATAASLFGSWWEQAVPLSEEQITNAIERQKTLTKQRRRPVDDETQPGHTPPRPNPIAPSTKPLDATPAPAASPPAITHLWSRDTITSNLDIAGQQHDWFESNSAIAAQIAPGTRVFSVGWAPPGGLIVLNAFTVTKVQRKGGAWHVSGDGCDTS